MLGMVIVLVNRVPVVVTVCADPVVATLLLGLPPVPKNCVKPGVTATVPLAQEALKLTVTVCPDSVCTFSIRCARTRVVAPDRALDWFQLMYRVTVPPVAPNTPWLTEKAPLPS